VRRPRTRSEFDLLAGCVLAVTGVAVISTAVAGTVVSVVGTEFLTGYDQNVERGRVRRHISILTPP